MSFDIFKIALSTTLLYFKYHMFKYVIQYSFKPWVLKLKTYTILKLKQLQIINYDRASDISCIW